MDLRRMALAVLVLVVVTGCGSDAVKAIDFLGAWSGTYTVTGEQSQAEYSFRLSVETTADENGVVAGNFESEHVTGLFAGTLDNTGTVVGQVENDADGTLWDATVVLLEGEITLELSSESASIEGMGAPGAPDNGLNYKTTVTNKTSKSLTMVFRVAKFQIEFEDIVTIAPGETYVDETGGWCPLGFATSWGTLSEQKCTSYYSREIHYSTGTTTTECHTVEMFGNAPELSWAQLPDTNCWGKLMDNDNFFWPCCRSRAWEIREDSVSFDEVTYPYSFTKL